MEKRHPKYILNRSPIRTRRCDVYKAPDCLECGCAIKKGDKYVARNAHYHYCIPCAQKLSDSIANCLKKHSYDKHYDAISRGRTMVKSLGVWQIPYECIHCRKYHLTTVQKKSVPQQLKKIYEYNNCDHALQQAIDKYLLEYEV